VRLTAHVASGAQSLETAVVAPRLIPGRAGGQGRCAPPRGAPTRHGWSADLFGKPESLAEQWL
jgi:hypothetical protein